MRADKSIRRQKKRAPTPKLRGNKNTLSITLDQTLTAWCDRMAVEALKTEGLRLSRSWVIEWCIRQVAEGRLRPIRMAKPPTASRPATPLRMIHTDAPEPETPVDLD